MSVRLASIENPNISVDVLEKSSRDKNALISKIAKNVINIINESTHRRYKTAEDTETPRYILLRLSKDENMDIREVAKNTLNVIDRPGYNPHEYLNISKIFEVKPCINETNTYKLYSTC